jgi:drug/metabolite transporter (DMT)-like permease
VSLWIAFTVVAAFLQTLRFVLQKRLAATGLSPAGATFARFLFAAPIALTLATLAVSQSGPLPAPPLTFWAAVTVGGLAQIAATDLTVRLFSLRNFAVGIAFTKTETVQVAIFGWAVLGEAVPPAGCVAIAVGVAGVLLMSRAPEPGAPLIGSAMLTGLLAGALFGVASVGYRVATLALEPAPFLTRAVVALAAATTIQSAAMSLWLRFREPGEVRRVLTGWQRTAPVGVAGMLGSLGWFAAFSLQTAAFVRAAGQIEMIFTLAASILVFGERLRLREAAGIVMVIGSLVGVVLSAP